MTGRVLALLGLALLLAPSAGAHTAQLRLTFLEGSPCPRGSASCIAVAATGQEKRHVEDRFARIEIAGVHPVELTLRNAGNVSHNLTFEPGTPAAGFGYDEQIAPNQTATINFTTVREIPPGRYAFFGGRPGHRAAGEEGTLVVVNGTQPADDRAHAPNASNRSDIADRFTSIPALPAPAYLLGLVALAVLARTRTGR